LNCCTLPIADQIEIVVGASVVLVDVDEIELTRLLCLIFLALFVSGELLIGFVVYF